MKEISELKAEVEHLREHATYLARQVNEVSRERDALKALCKETPLYRGSPTAKEERAVVRAAVKWAQTGDWRELEPLGDAVDRLLAKRKKAK